MLMFSIGVGVYRTTHGPRLRGASVAQAEPPHDMQPAPQTTRGDRISFSDLLTEAESLRYNGYLIVTRYKKVDDEWLREEQGYAALVWHGKTIQSFDGRAYHAWGNITLFGLFSFLGTAEQQVAISQDIHRGGAQWIVDLSSEPSVIFDSVEWGTGRESDHCEVEDMDGDGIFEISLPITDFYALMDKMSMSEIPEPMITFKYDKGKKKYFPVNHVLPHPNRIATPDLRNTSNELYIRSVVLDHLLDLVYQGEREEAWRYFDRTYNLDDKSEIEQRVKRILKDQPVYKYIYKQ